MNFDVTPGCPTVTEVLEEPATFIFCRESAGTRFLQNTGNGLQTIMAAHPRCQECSQSLQ
jgi:hypothetical protein